MRAILFALIAGFGLLVASCATLSPEQEARRALFLEAAKECESRFRPIRLIQVKDVDADGKVYFQHYVETYAETEQFIACYQERVQEKISAMTRIASGRLSLAAGDPPTTSVPIRIVGGITLVEAAINESRMAMLVLDTGASNTIISPALANESKITVPKNAPQRMLVGVGGKVAWMPFARVQSLKVGSFAVEDLDVGVYDAFPGVQRLDGLLGADFLSHFSVTIDPSSQVLTLEPKPPPASGEVLPSPQSTTGEGTDSLIWKPGYEWSFRWESAGGKGTFVWVVTAETEVNGVRSYVVKSGSQEIVFAKVNDKLGRHVVKDQGVLIERWSPPDFSFVWPLQVGKSWDYTYTWEEIPAGRTEEGMRRCAVEAAELITVPAGTFETLRVTCTNLLGHPAYTYWFSEAVKMFVKDRSYRSYGGRVREMTGYKLD